MGPAEERERERDARPKARTEDRRQKTNGSRRPGIDLRLLRNIHYSKFVSGNRAKDRGRVPGGYW